MFLRVIIVALLLTGPTGALFSSTASAQEVTPEERYELGLKYMKRGNYVKALEQFNRVRNYHRDHPVAVTAELAIAELHFKQGEYEQARYAYEDFARLHPRHEDMDLVTYKIGHALYKRAPRLTGRDQTPTRQAVNAWTGFATRFPNSEHIVEVEELLVKSLNRLAKKELDIATFYAKKEAWGATRSRAETMLQDYPESDHAAHALFLAGNAAWRWGDAAAAQEYLTRLSTEHAGSSYATQLTAALQTPPGGPPVDEVFTRPYRIRGGGQQAGGGMPGM